MMEHDEELPEQLFGILSSLRKNEREGELVDGQERKYCLSDDCLVELFVLMTSPLGPILDVKDHELEEDRDVSQFDRRMSERLKSHTDYKAVFEKSPLILRAILDLLSTYLSDEKWEMGRRSRKDEEVIRLLLSFYNNLVAIEDLSVLHMSGIQMQHQLVILYHEERIFETLFNLVSIKKELSQWNLIIAEIFYHVFYNIDPRDLLKDHKAEAESRAQKLLEEELNKRELNRIRNTRHNGTYWINVPGKEYTVRKRDAVRGLVTKVVDSIKKEMPTRKPLVGEYDKRKRSVRIRGPAQRYLKLVATQFLTRAFNGMTYSLYCIRLRKIWKNSALLKFFLEFRNLLRNSDEPLEELTFDEFTKSQYDYDCVSTIMSPQGFDFVFNLIGNDRDDKLWSNIHFGLECLKQMAMKRSNDRQIRYKAEYIINKIYYNQDNLGLMVSLIKDYKGQSFGYLQSLIATIHVLLERLESCSKTKYEIVVKSSQKDKNDDDDPEHEEDHNEMETEFSKVDREFHENHKCIFELFEKKFVSDSVVSTFCKYLENYESLDSEGLDWHDRLGIVIALIFEERKLNLIRWIQRYIEKVADERKSSEFDVNQTNVSEDAEFSIGPPKLVSNHVIEPDNEEIEDAIEYDSNFRLLLEVMDLRREDGENQTRWLIPDSFSSEDLLNLSIKIDEFVENPFTPSEENESLMHLDSDIDINEGFSSSVNSSSSDIDDDKIIYRRHRSTVYKEDSDVEDDVL
ncbi:4358_t:CDS:10 [Acaulospora colombiana]|uniref:4358_t:CDS:1 n=1 Tax=Acaulospora colombiana TaxID=27376 RepID=A0ACA9KV26_9GLOM|nr:4358_t:CDS:10 [Acaulospora colombiana]